MLCTNHPAQNQQHNRLVKEKGEEVVPCVRFVSFRVFFCFVFCVVFIQIPPPFFPRGTSRLCFVLVLCHYYFSTDLCRIFPVPFLVQIFIKALATRFCSDLTCVCVWVVF